MQAVSSSVETRLEIQKLNALPALSIAASRFLEAIQDPDIEIRELGAIIEQDPALLARLVGLANSAYFGYPERVYTAEDAILKVLGLNTAKSLALSMVLSGPFRATHCPGFNLGAYWESAMLTASLARDLARHVVAGPAPTPGAAYLSGLIHSLGLLALVYLYPEVMNELFRTRMDEPQSLLIADEVALVGASHQEVGGWLGRKWHLPPHVIAVLEHHLEFSYRGDHWPLVRLVGAAARWTARIPLDDRVLAEPPALDGLGIPAHRIEAAIGKLLEGRDQIREMASLLSIA